LDDERRRLLNLNATTTTAGATRQPFRGGREMSTLAIRNRRVWNERRALANCFSVKVTTIPWYTAWKRVAERDIEKAREEREARELEIIEKIERQEKFVVDLLKKRNGTRALIRYEKPGSKWIYTYTERAKGYDERLKSARMMLCELYKQAGDE